MIGLSPAIISLKLASAASFSSCVMGSDVTGRSQAPVFGLKLGLGLRLTFHFANASQLMPVCSSTLHGTHIFFSHASHQITRPLSLPLSLPVASSSSSSAAPALTPVSHAKSPPRRPEDGARKPLEARVLEW